MAASEIGIRVKSIKVTGLFGLYDHLVTLKEDRVTVIHGPNGVGKTAFLKLTHSFLTGKYHLIAKVPFNSFEILFDDDTVARIAHEGEPGNGKKLTLTYHVAGAPLESITIEAEQSDSLHLATQVERSSPYLHQVGPEEWIDRRTDEIIDSDEVISRFGEFLPNDKRRGTSKEPKGLRVLRSRINVHLIDVQRLIKPWKGGPEWRSRSADRPTTATVQQYSRDLKRSLESTLANYAKQSQKLDQTFPQRLLKGATEVLTIEQLKSEMQDVEATRSRLEKIGILDSGDAAQDPYPLQISQLDDLQPAQMSVMSVYARDTKEKLSVLTELSERIELLLEVLNRKFANKTVTISRESGLAVIGSNEKSIPITALSSGEQHELVLLYDLLFKVRPNALVLIDEPELSLHIGWQKGFMDDLLEIIRLAQFDVLMATHSPYIVGDRSDLMVVLSSNQET